MRIDTQSLALLLVSVAICVLIAVLFDSPTSVLLLILVIVGGLLLTVYSGRRTR